jgi:hypothetical protein
MAFTTLMALCRRLRCVGNLASNHRGQRNSFRVRGSGAGANRACILCAGDPATDTAPNDCGALINVTYVTSHNDPNKDCAIKKAGAKAFLKFLVCSAQDAVWDILLYKLDPHIRSCKQYKTRVAQFDV